MGYIDKIMARSSWKPCAMSNVAVRRVMCLTNVVHSSYRYRYARYLRYFSWYHVDCEESSRLLRRYIRSHNFYKVDGSVNDFSQLEARTFFNKRISSACGVVGRYKFIIRQLAGSFKWLVINSRPKDRILRIYRFMRIRLKLKGGYKITSQRVSKQTRRLHYLLIKQIGISKYYTDRRFGEFITTRVRGHFRKNKDKAKITKLKKDLAKARRRQKHQVAENARIWKKVLQESKGKGGKGGKAAKKPKGGRRKVNK